MASFNFYNIFRVISAENLSPINFQEGNTVAAFIFLNDFRVISTESLRDSAKVKSTKINPRDSTLPDLIMVVRELIQKTLATAKYELSFDHKQCGKINGKKMHKNISGFPSFS